MITNKFNTLTGKNLEVCAANLSFWGHGQYRVDRLVSFVRIWTSSQFFLHSLYSKSRWPALIKVTQTLTGHRRWRSLLLAHRLGEEGGLGKAPSGMCPRMWRSAPSTETPATWMLWGGPSNASVAITSQRLLNQWVQFIFIPFTSPLNTCSTTLLL